MVHTLLGSSFKICRRSLKKCGDGKQREKRRKHAGRRSWCVPLRLCCLQYI
jgi:hypothetical protein